MASFSLICLSREVSFWITIISFCDENLVFALLGLKTHLFDQCADVLDRIVGRRVEFDDIKGRIFGKRAARRTFAASLVVGRRILAVQNFRQNPCARCFAHATRAGEQKSVRDLAGGHRIFERAGHVRLADDVFESLRAIFSSRNNELAHGGKGNFLDF